MTLIDQEILDGILQGDDELLADLATIFAQHMPDIETRINVAFADGDASGVYENAHQLKSRLGYFGATSLQAIALELETMSRENQLQSCEASIQQLLVGCRDLILELNQLTGLSLSMDENE